MLGPAQQLVSLSHQAAWDSLLERLWCRAMGSQCECGQQDRPCRAGDDRACMDCCSLSNRKTKPVCACCPSGRGHPGHSCTQPAAARQAGARGERMLVSALPSCKRAIGQCWSPAAAEVRQSEAGHNLSEAPSSGDPGCCAQCGAPRHPASTATHPQSAVSTKAA